MLIQCQSCDWKFYIRDRDRYCPICGEYLSSIVEVGAEEDPEVDEYLKNEYREIEGDL